MLSNSCKRLSSSASSLVAKVGINALASSTSVIQRLASWAISNWVNCRPAALASSSGSSLPSSSICLSSSLACLSNSLRAKPERARGGGEGLEGCQKRTISGVSKTRRCR